MGIYIISYSYYKTIANHIYLSSHYKRIVTKVASTHNSITLSLYLLQVACQFLQVLSKDFLFRTESGSSATLNTCQASLQQILWLHFPYSYIRQNSNSLARARPSMECLFITAIRRFPSSSGKSRKFSFE